MTSRFRSKSRMDYIYIGANIFPYMYRKLITFQPELDGD